VSTARELVRKCLDLPVVLDRLGDDDDLLTSGVNSGEMVRVALGCEERLGRPLTDDELAGLDTVNAIARVLGEV
jgi:hypothetical protein